MTNASRGREDEGVGVGVGVVVGVEVGGVEEAMAPEIQYMGHIAYSVVAPVIISFGILTNILNLVVLTRPSLRGPTFRYLKWLAVANLLVCVVLLPFTLHSHADPVPYLAALYLAHVEVPVGNALIASSVYIVVGLSIDRFVAVCYPRKYRNLHSHYVASVRIAVSFVLAFFIYVPMAFYKQVVPAGGAPGRFLASENMQVVTARWFLVYEYMVEISVRFVPAVLLGVLNTWIIIEFKRISRRRRLLAQGMSCEVSAIPSQSYIEPNANTTVVNNSPTTAQSDPELRNATEQTHAHSHINSNRASAIPQLPRASHVNLETQDYTGDSQGIPITTITNSTFAQNSTTNSTFALSSTSDSSTLAHSRETSFSELPALESTKINSRISGPRVGYKISDNGVVGCNGYQPVATCEEPVSTRNSSARSFSRNKETEAVGLSMINVEGTPNAVPPTKPAMSERRHDMERRLVLLLISIIVAFFITNIPAAILSLTFRDDKRNDLNFQIFRAIANNLEFLNFGLNFILYFLFSKDIRNAFTALIRRTVDRLKEGLEGSTSKYAATNL